MVDSGNTVKYIHLLRLLNQHLFPNNLHQGERMFHRAQITTREQVYVTLGSVSLFLPSL